MPDPTTPSPVQSEAEVLKELRKWLATEQTLANEQGGRAKSLVDKQINYVRASVFGTVRRKVDELSAGMDQ